MRKMLLAAALLSSLAGGVAIAGQAAPDLAALASRPVAPNGLRIFQHVAPPDDDIEARRFAFGPVTDAMSSQIARNLATKWTGRTHAMVWGMRGPSDDLKANPVLPRIDVGGREAGMEFTSYARADAATLALVAYHCGHAPHQRDRQGYLDILNAAGMADGAWIDHARARASASTLFTREANHGERMVVIDRVVGPDARQWDVPRARRTGIVIDWEVSDGRSGNYATNVLFRAARMIGDAGMESTLYLNPLTGGNIGQEGLDAASLSALHARFRWLTVTVWPGSIEGDAAAAIRAQLRLLQGARGQRPIDYSRLQLTVGIGDEAKPLTGRDAASARSALRGTLSNVPTGAGRHQKFGALNIWRARGKPEVGSAYNRTVATLIGANDN